MTWGKREWACASLGWASSLGFLAIKRFGLGAPIEMVDAGVALVIGFVVPVLAMRVTRPKPAYHPLVVEDFEPIQAYDRFPEPKPRDGATS